METDRQRMDFPRAGKKGHKIAQERYVHWFTDKPSRDTMEQLAADIFATVPSKAS